MRKILLLLLGVLGFAYPAAGIFSETIIVSLDGGGMYSSIQPAIDIAGKGDRIVIRAGEYYESLRIANKEDLLIQGEGEVWVKAPGEESIISIEQSTRITMIGLKGIHVSEGGCYNNVIGIMNSRDIAVSGCTLNGSGIYGFDVSQSENIVLNCNTILKCTSVGASIYSSKRVTIERNVFHDNAGWKGVALYQSDDVTIRNNTIAGNDWAPVIEIEGGQAVRVINNILAFNAMSDETASVISVINSTPAVSKNLIYQNGKNNQDNPRYSGFTPADEINGNPLFTDYQGREFRLNSGSPAAGAGENQIDLGAVPQSAYGDNRKQTANLMDAGISFFNARNFEPALQCFKQVVDIDPDNPDVLNAAGSCYLGLRDFGQAEYYYRQVLQKNPGYANACYNMACLYSLQNNADEAWVWLEKALQSGYNDFSFIMSDPDFENIRSRERFGAILSKYGYAAGNQRVISNQSEYEQGITAYSNKDYSSAVTHFQNTLQVSPNNLDACYYMGMSYLALNDRNNAISSFYRAISIDPNHAESYFYLANACYLAGDYGQAVLHYLKVEELNPKHSDLYNNLGLSYMNQGNYAQAELYIKKALLANPDDYNANTSLGVLFINLREYSTSEHYIKRTIEIDPNNPNGYYNMACLYSVQNRADEALNWLEQALAKGYKDWEHMGKDTDLDNIRNTQRFMDLRMQYDENAGY